MEGVKRRKFLALFSGLIFVITCFGGIYMLVKAFHQFFSETSNFRQFEEPISELPTFVICTSGTVWNYEIKFGISFDIDGDFHTDFDNHGFESNTQKIYSYFSGICYQISFLKTEEIRKETLTSIDLFFNKSISFDELPDLNFYMTSEKNANGIVFNDWMDGEEFTFKIDKEKWTRYDAWMKIRQEKYRYLSDTLFNTKEDCVKESYYECATSKILISDFQHWNDCSDCNCTSKCLPSYLHNLFDNETTLHSLARALQ